jgi:hypothetical protein
MSVAFFNCLFHPSKKDDAVTSDPFTFNEHIKNLLEFARFGESVFKLKSSDEKYLN